MLDENIEFEGIEGNDLILILIMSLYNIFNCGTSNRKYYYYLILICMR